MHSCQCMPLSVGFCNEKSTDLVDEGGEAVVEGHDLVLLLSADGLDGGVDRQVEGGEQTLVDGDSCDGWCYESTTSTSTTHGQSVATTTSAESQATSSEPQATYTSTEAAAEASTTSADAGTTSADAVAVAGAGATATTSQGQATTADGAAGEAPPHAAAATEAATATATAAESG